LLEAARQLVGQGINPTIARKQSMLAAHQDRQVTLSAMAHEWMAENAAHWSASTSKQVSKILPNDLLNEYGSLPIREVTSAHILAAIRKVEARGAKSIAKMLRQWTGAIFRYAIANLQAESDPTYALRGSIRMPAPRHHAHLSAEEMPAFLKALAAYKGYGITPIATKLLLLTIVRTTELRLAEWSEFNLDAAEWRIPAERMKMGEPHIVPLSTQAVALLKELHQITGGRQFAFPNARSPNDGLTNTTILRVIEFIGYKGRVTGHGFRGTASTILYENGFPEHVIERQLAHSERNKVKAAYNHAQYLDDRRAMLQWWADWLDGQAK
jgi:integrase